MATIQARIESLIGTSYADTLAITSNGIKELYVNAIATVMDTLPRDISLRYCQREILGNIGYLKLTGVTTNASTEVFTSTGHGLIDGNTVSLSDFTESTGINGITGVVETSTEDTFKVANVVVDIAETTGGTVERTGSTSGKLFLEYIDAGFKIIGASWGGGSGDKYTCQEVDSGEANRMTNNSNSIYALNNSTDILTPVFYIEPSSVDANSATNSVIKVIPTPSDTNKAIIYYQEYISIGDVDLAADTFIGKTGSSSDTAVELGNNLPMRTYQAVIIKTCELIVSHLIGQAVTEEEDPELLGLYQSQLQTLKGMYMEEISALTGGQPIVQAEG